MKTYRELLRYAEELPRRPLTCFSNELEVVFDLPYYTLNEAEAFEAIESAEVVSADLNNRAYNYQVLYFREEAFAIYTWGGRGSSDYENYYVVNKEVWNEAREYALSLLFKEDAKVIPLDSYINPEYGGYYPWEFLSN